jgi:signal transduction histidine kinase
VVLEPAPEAYNTPLTRWDHLWRYAAAVLISGLAWGEIAYHEWHDGSPWFWIDLAGGIVSFGIAHYRRRWPLPVAVVLVLFGLFSVSSSGPGVLAVVSLVTRRDLRKIIPVALLNIVSTQLYASYQPAGHKDPAWVTFTFTIVVTVAVVAFGLYIGSRRELIWTLRERARQAESEQELRVGRARSSERERIAREMHDVLAHRISLVTMHAGALAYRTDLSPEQVRETAQLIQTKAHEALTDLRQVLGMLRGEDGVPHRPQPTLADLETLMEEARTSGMVVDYRDQLGAARQPAEQVGRTVYRIVQEALTNARKHAAGTHVSVTVGGDAARGITVVVGNAKPVGVPARRTAPGSGLGLVGLRERAALTGGTLNVDETDGAFTLRGWLPWAT